MLLAGWGVRIGKNCDRGLENAARGRRPRAAFSSSRSQFFPIWTDPKPDNNIFIFFSCCTLAFKWVCLRNSVIELAFCAVYKPFAQKQNNNDRTREYLLDKEICMQKQIYFELLDVSCIYFTSEVLQKCLFRCEISCKVWSCQYKNNFCQSLRITRNQTFLP